MLGFVAMLPENVSDLRVRRPLARLALHDNGTAGRFRHPHDSRALTVTSST